MLSANETFPDHTDVISTAQRNHSEVLSPHIWMVTMPRMRLDNFAPELKVEIILHLPNPTLLAKCSREWNNIINLPATKAKWLIGRHGLTHALFHAVRMGEPFINLSVVECLFAQKAHISRYFIQRLVLGFGKYDSRLIDLKLTGNLDPDRKKSIQNKIRSPWTSNLSFDVFSRILKEGHDRFDGNDIPVRRNDMESFYYLSAGPLVISQAKTKLKENTREIITLIQRYKFAPFPPRPKIRKHILEKKEGEGIGLKSTEIESSSRTANFDDYPPSDGYVIAHDIIMPPRTIRVPVLSSVDPVVQTPRKRNTKETKKEKEGVQQKRTIPPRMCLNNLPPELKVEIILHLRNPTPLAKCSREWNNTVNLPYIKAKWLIVRHGRTHALFHAVRMGETFINLNVVECLFAQKAHISRYFIQRLVLGFGKYDSGLFDLKLAHNISTHREIFIQNKIQSPWASNLSFDVYSRILKEGHDRFDGNVRGNDMESFYYLSAGPSGISQARTKLKENKREIKTLIRKYKFAPFPPRPKNILEKKKGEKIGLFYSDIESESRVTNFDGYPLSDGYENVRQLNVIARAIVIYPKLVNIWKKNGYHEVVSDVNDLAIQGSLLLLYPPSPPEDWIEPDADQVVEKLNSLISLGFELTDALIGDILILLFKRKLRNIGDTLVRAFAMVKKKDILPICLKELLNSERTFKHHDSLEFVINRIDKPEEKILFHIEENGIENPLDVYMSNGSIPQAYTILKYPPIVYEYMLVKFGAKSRVTRYLMKEITTARIGKAKLRKSYPSLALSSVLLETKWQELDNIFNIYCLAGVPFEPKFLPLIKNCPSDMVSNVYLRDIYIDCLGSTLILSRQKQIKYQYWTLPHSHNTM